MQSGLTAISGRSRHFRLHSASTAAIRIHQYRPDRYQKVRQMAAQTGGLRLERPHSSDCQLSATNPIRCRLLLGYDFGPLTLQAYATTDVVEHNYGGRDTRGWFRMIIRLSTPPAMK
jgi:hypothetical protein